jgi:hypothetical protein
MLRVVNGTLATRVKGLRRYFYQGQRIDPSALGLNEVECDRLIAIGTCALVTSEGWSEGSTEPGKKGTVNKSRWSIDPATLRGMTLEQLNVMVAERDEKGEIKAFTTIEEAIAFLSQDFEAIV